MQHNGLAFKYPKHNALVPEGIPVLPDAGDVTGGPVSCVNLGDVIEDVAGRGEHWRALWSSAGKVCIGRLERDCLIDIIKYVYAK